MSSQRLGPSVYDDYFGAPYGSFGSFSQADRKETGRGRGPFFFFK